MEQLSSSSKVTVEYFDPHGVYQLLSSGLLPRLPLHNLHWESHSGPLRSISTLHVDFVPSTDNLSQIKSQESGRSGSVDDGVKTQQLGQPASDRPASSSGPGKTVKERRHQIPGLRQTPYLKVLLLRCDDNDTYKSQARKEVREWIKEHTNPSSSASKTSAQEKHDAFEWLIIHVVIPNTAAATQPRTSGKSSSEDSTAASLAEKSGIRWRGGGSTTILEKLRADFNGASKGSIDRIAQVRIGINDVPYDILPRVVPAIPGSYTESPQDNEASWQDLMSKLKTLILSSFDSRVSQYEEDIKEKDSQRTLPGWNFCTFFVLKEGLARGFENVGLVEDALVGYDELSVGLDAIIREQASDTSATAPGGSFLPYTDRLKRQVDQALAGARQRGTSDNSAATFPHDDPDEIILSSSRKPYRELILSNDVSVFDFRCYIFARQVSLLLRMGNAWSSREELLAKLKEQREASLQGVAARQPPEQSSDEAEDLTMLAEICRRSLDFIASISRIMREDIRASQSARRSSNGGPGSADSSNDTPYDPLLEQVIDNVVSSFTFSVAQQILAQTSTKSLPIPPSTLSPVSGTFPPGGHEPKAAIPEPKTMMHPARTTSLSLHPPVTSPGLFPGGRSTSMPGPNNGPNAPSPYLKNGLESLASHRAHLYILSRSVLEHLGHVRDWTVGWRQVLTTNMKPEAVLEDVNLGDGEAGKDSSAPPSTPPFLNGIDNQLLRAALASLDDFYRLYETLTDKSLRHSTVADRTQSMQTNMAELAVLKFYLRDYAAAASYFYRMTPFYGEEGWSQIEINMLVMYVKCLKELQCNDEYVRVTVKLLAKGAAREKEKIIRKAGFRKSQMTSFANEEVDLKGHLSDLMSTIKVLEHEVSVNMTSFFSNIEVEATPRYHDSQDTVALQLQLRYLLEDALHIDRVRVRIAAIGPSAAKDIWLESREPLDLTRGIVRFQVESNAIIPGTYVVDQVLLQADKLVLKYEYDEEETDRSSSDAFLKCPKLLIYQRPEALDIKLFASRYMHLDKNRSLELELSSGWNQILRGELHVRPATAGLRLKTGEVEVINGSLDISQDSPAGIIEFGSFGRSEKVKIRMPFSLEREVSEVALRLELSYTTEAGTFQYASNPTMSILLPLGVNVQDIFKHKALFSRFTVTSSTSSPLRLLSSRLEDSEMFAATNGGRLTSPVVVFPRQPASLLYRIAHKSQKDIQETQKRPGNKTSLSLVLHYICLEEEIDQAVTHALSDALRDTPVHQYSRLIIPAVLFQLHSRLSSYDMERTALLSEVSTASLESIRWRDIFAGLGKSRNNSEADTSSLVAQWLQDWQAKTPAIPLLPIDLSPEAISSSRSIVIPVDVPSVDVVFTADLKLDPASSSTNDANTLILNKAIPATLHLKYTRIWATNTSRPNNTSQDLEFLAEISAPTDTWLVGGRRKAHFKIPTAISPSSDQSVQSLKFPVLLIPLKEGYYPFPHVEIKPVPVAKTDAGAAGGAEPHIACETDLRNAGEVVRVVGDAWRTTVSLDASGPQGGAWLLECERRGESGVVV